jgi:CheY-like chemotaxis protein
MNLCTNAAHAMEDEGGRLTVDLFDAGLDPEFVPDHPDLKPGPYINLTVTDTGHGMSPVFLPAIEKDLEPEAINEKPYPTGTERILFIDDEPDIVNMGRQTLESLGYDVTARTSSIEALECFKVQPDRFDLVITDMTMPKMTGEILADEIMRIRSDIPVILCTGFSARIDETKAMKMHIQAFVSKPILKRELAEIIRKVLDNK